MPTRIKKLAPVLRWPREINPGTDVGDPPPDPYLRLLTKEQLVRYERIRLAMYESIFKARLDALNSAMELTKSVR